jgi:hypothetical protein
MEQQPTIWESNPRLKTLLLVLIVVFFLSGVGLVVFSQWSTSFRQKVYEETESGLPKHQVPADVSGWKTYKDNNFEFKYPEKLKLSEVNGKVTLSHSIRYDNLGECDMVGSDKKNATLTDFSISFEKKIENSKLDYIDGNYESGSLKGSWQYSGAEGCGELIYNFSMKDNSLVVRRSAIQATSGISSAWNLDEILKVPQVISKEESQMLFDQILLTFKFIK